MKIALAVSLVVNLALLIALAVFSDRPSVDSVTGKVVNVSTTAIVVQTEDGRINGLLATEDQIKPGDRVSVQYMKDPNVLVVAKK